MARYGVRHSCGHIETVNLGGPERERERMIAWLKERPCFDCHRQAESVEAARAAEVDGLPTLTGTGKQIEWAMRSRQQQLTKVASMRDEYVARGERAIAAGKATADEVRVGVASAEASIGRLASRTSASWWIDRRSYSVRELLAEVE